MKLIKRKDYLDKAIGAIGTPDIKVITGAENLSCLRHSGAMLPKIFPTRI